MAKRVLIFSLNYIPFVGGAEIAVKEITDRIAPNDIEFHLIAYRFNASLPREERIGNVTVHRIGFGKKGMAVKETFNPLVYLEKVLYIPFAALTAARLNRTYHFDAFWALMSYMLFPIVLLRLLGNRVPYMLTLQEGDPFERVFERMRIRIVAPLLRYGFKHAAAVQAISTFLLEWSKQLGFKGHGEVIPNGVDTKAFTHTFSEDEIRDTKESLGKKEKDIFLVTTSRLVHKNAVDTVIRALPLLPPHTSFLIYGTGPDEGALRALAQELGVESRARFMGHIDHADMPRMLRACDIFIRPSRSEGMGNSFIEAMAAGLPVIATQEGGIADFLFDAKRNPNKETTGWAVDVDSPQQIVDSVEDITGDSQKTERVTKTAKTMVQDQYDWGHIAENMSTLLGRTVSAMLR